MKEDCFLRKAFNEGLANQESRWVTKMRHLVGYWGMSNLIFNIFKVLNDKIDQKEYKSKQIFFQKRAMRTVKSKPSFTLIKKKIILFHKQKNFLKRKDI